MANPRYGEGPDTRRAILACVGLITPKWPRQLALEVGVWVGEDFGERRTHRWLKRLVAEGVVVRTPRGYLLARQRRTA